MPRADKRQLIMRAVEQLFTSRRFHEITLDDVAQAAGVGKGTIYRYFKDKDDLFLQTVMAGFDELCDVLRSATPADATFEEQLRAACSRISDFFERRRQMLRMMQSEDARLRLAKGGSREQWMAQRRKLVDTMAGIIDAGVEEGRIRGDIPSEVLAAFLLGLMRTRAHELTDTPQARLSDGDIVELFLNGAGQASS